MNRTELHLEVERVLPQFGRTRAATRTLTHALIAMGLVSKIECMYEDCVLETREFTPFVKGMSRGAPGVLTIDHIIELDEGGTDYPENLQIMHFICNSTKGQRRKMRDPAQRKRVSDQARARWADPEQRDIIIARVAASGRTAEVRAKRSEAMKRHWNDPERRAQHAARLPRGEAWHAARQKKDED